MSPGHRPGRFTMWTIVGLSLAMVGCALARSPAVPMRVTAHPQLGPEEADGLAILLPGQGDSPSDFVRNGFVGLLHQRTRLDVVAPNAHFGYYRTRQLRPRIKQDVVARARSRGYHRLWLVGISMGGMGALALAADADWPVEGVLLLAPYLGSRSVHKEIRAAGGLDEWDPGPTPLPAQATERQATRHFWAWLKRNRAADWPVPVYLGYGCSDRLRPGHDLLAASLPADRVVVSAGGHHWPVWRELFGRMLARALPADRTTTEASASRCP